AVGVRGRVLLTRPHGPREPATPTGDGGLSHTRDVAGRRYRLDIAYDARRSPAGPATCGTC
ncbi:MAG: hypothetical protein ABR608_01465, partial [Pseudonocardiaceae bacterium]